MSDQQKPYQLKGVSFGLTDGTTQDIPSARLVSFESPPGEPLDLDALGKGIDSGLATFTATWHLPAMNWDDYVALLKVFGIMPVRITWIRPRYGYRRTKPGVN